MNRTKKLFISLLVLLVAGFGLIKPDIDGHWLQEFSQQARYSKTCHYYDANQGGYEASAAEWTRAAFD